MSGYTLQSSLEERARKKRRALDIVASRKKYSVVTPSPSFYFSSQAPSYQKAFDGIQSAQPQTKEEQKRHPFLGKYFLLWQRIFFVFHQRYTVLAKRVVPQFMPHKMLYGSLIGGIAFGMVSMAFMEHYFGPGVFARSQVSGVSEQVQKPDDINTPPASIDTYNPEQDIFFEYFGQVTKEKYEGSIREMVKGYPIEEMLPYIFAQDRLTAAFLIGIAKKESNWGKRIPVLADQDCFNYWGYRGVRRMMGSGGHTCFNSRKDAVETVSARLNKLIHSEQLNTPEKMIVWKCGFSCQGHSRESVKKWISDVDIYFSQLSDE